MSRSSFHRVCFAMTMISVFLVLSCKKTDPTNPYDSIEPVITNTPNLSDIPVNNFAWLHGKIFKPTCANSGCHDGTFEPEFRSISSAYNSLVNHPVISNDSENSFEYRVSPGNASSSLLHARLTTVLPNSSGMMPLEVDEDSDWDDNTSNYIQAITDWINNGAKDMYGQSPASGQSDFPPQIGGVVVFPEGNTTEPYERDPESVGITPILVDAASIDIWVQVTDDNTPVGSIGINEFRYAESISELDTAPSILYSTGQNLLATDFSGNAVDFGHRVTIDLSGFVSGTTFFIRSYFDDGVQSQVTEIPGEGSNPYITAIFTIQIL
jgi:hypothetical protein